jgi:hypothetical protein
VAVLPFSVYVPALERGIPGTTSAQEEAVTVNVAELPLTVPVYVPVILPPPPSLPPPSSSSSLMLQAARTKPVAMITAVILIKNLLIVLLLAVEYTIKSLPVQSVPGNARRTLTSVFDSEASFHSTFFLPEPPPKSKR